MDEDKYSKWTRFINENDMTIKKWYKKQMVQKTNGSQWLPIIWDEEIKNWIFIVRPEDWDLWIDKYYTPHVKRWGEE